MYGIIYLLTSPSGKHYVGQTTGSLTERWKQHVRAPGCMLLYRAIEKYGPDSFEKDIVAECPDKAELDRLERFWIKLLNSNNPLYGYNLRDGGARGKHSAESNDKNRQAHIGLMAGENHPFFGKHHSDETKQKISRAKQGIPRADGGVMLGKHHSDETKQKMRETHLGDKAPWFGKHLSDETKLKLSEAHKGRDTMPKETRKRLGEATRLRWAKYRQDKLDGDLS